MFSIAMRPRSFSSHDISPRETDIWVYNSWFSKFKSLADHIDPWFLEVSPKPYFWTDKPLTYLTYSKTDLNTLEVDADVPVIFVGGCASGLPVWATDVTPVPTPWY